MPFVAELDTGPPGELFGAENGGPVFVDNEAASTDVHRSTLRSSCPGSVSLTRCERKRVVGHGQCQHVTNAAHAPRRPDRVGVPHMPCSRSATGHRELPCPTAFPCRDPVRLGMRGSPGSPDERYAQRCPVPSGVLPGSNRENSPRDEHGGHHRRPSHPFGSARPRAGAADPFRARGQQQTVSTRSSPGSARSGRARCVTPLRAW